MKKKIIFSAISEKEYEQAKALIEKVKGAEDRKKYALEIAEQVLRLTDEALMNSFIQPLDLIKVGSFTKASAKIALNVAQSGVNSVVKKILKGLDNDQLLIIVDFLDNILGEIEVLPTNET